MERNERDDVKMVRREVNGMDGEKEMEREER